LGRAELVAGGENLYASATANHQRAHAGRRGKREVERAEPLARRQHQLAGSDVLADRSDVLTWRRGRMDLGHFSVEVDPFVWNHRIPTSWEWVAGVDKLKLA
jgi:hypothetical protein